MPPLRHRQPQQRLQQPMHMRRLKQILPPRHQRHPLQRIIHHHRQMITRRHLLPRQHHIPKHLRPRHLLPPPQIPPPQLPPHPRHRLHHIQPQRIPLPTRHPLLPLPHTQPPTRPRIQHPIRPMRRLPHPRHLLLNRLPRAKTRIQQPQRLQRLQRLPIIPPVLTLLPHRLLPRHPQPSQILKNPRLILRPHPRPIDVLQPHQKPPPSFHRRPPRLPRRKHMPQMQPTRRTWRKSCYHFSLHHPQSSC